MIELYGISIKELPPVQDALTLLKCADAWKAQHAGFLESDATRASLGGLLLLQYAGLGGTLCYTSNGRPYLAEQAVDFSVTHTKTRVFCAIDRAAKEERLGLDAEDLKRRMSLDPMCMAKRWFSDAEQAFLAKEPTQKRFLQLWTRKEAYVKRNGKGLGGIREADTLSLRVNEEVDFFEYTLGETLVSLCVNKGRCAPAAIAIPDNRELLEKLKNN